MDFKKILNNKKQALINLICVQKRLVGGIQTLQKDWNKNIQLVSVFTF